MVPRTVYFLLPMTPLPQKYDALILGAGAAGLMCAIEAGRRGRHVAVLELAERAGKKILISGGGRCNFTNIHCAPENFISSNPHFAKSALARYTPADFIALVEKHHIPYHEKTLGQLFCDRSAQDILGMLEEECAAAGVRLFTKTAVQEVVRSDGFVLRAGEKEFRAPVLVVATGGLSIPKIGATDFGYRLARQFRLGIRETRPGLVPVTFNDEDSRAYADLAGVSTEVIAACDGQRFREKMLVTHRGLSGPAILQISSYWKKGQPILLDLVPGSEVTASLQQPASPRTVAALRAALQTFLPNRLANRWVEMNPPRWLDECGAARTGAPGPRVENAAGGHRRLRQGRGHSRRRRHRRAIGKDHGKPESARPVLHRRSRGCNRTSGGIQFSVGMGIGSQCGTGIVRARQWSLSVWRDFLTTNHVGAGVPPAQPSKARQFQPK